MVSHDDVAQPSEPILDSLTLLLSSATRYINQVDIPARVNELPDGVNPSRLGVDDWRDNQDVLAESEHVSPLKPAEHHECLAKTRLVSEKYLAL